MGGYSKYQAPHHRTAVSLGHHLTHCRLPQALQRYFIGRLRQAYETELCTHDEYSRALDDCVTNADAEGLRAWIRTHQYAPYSSLQIGTDNSSSSSNNNNNKRSTAYNGNSGSGHGGGNNNPPWRRQQQWSRDHSSTVPSSATHKFGQSTNNGL
eukprot:Lankesteria_metandrocarpae@DN4475_c0_g1_i1.p3